MTQARDNLVNLIWQGRNPYAGFEARLYRTEYGGWGSEHPYLSEAVMELHPSLVVEVGVWNGASVRTMATCLRQLGTDSALLAIDTWLGSAEQWLDNQDSLCFSQGRPGKQLVFMANVVEWDLTQYVVPLPLDSLNAAEVVASHRLFPELIHIDGGHDYESVAADLRTWWPRLRPGGILIGDDYYVDGTSWPGVRRAFDEFFTPLGLGDIEHHTGKCRIRKRSLGR